MIKTSEYIKQAYKDAQGFISRMYIENQMYGTFTYHYSKDNLAELPALDEENLYISQNTFFRPERNKDSLKRLNMLYIDLDCYKLGLSKEYVFDLLCDEYIGRKIPRPTYIIDSGRGLYLLWHINEDRNAFPRWKRVQHFLHEALKDLGSDSTVTEDVARVLRIPGSINSKIGTRVEILNECNYTYSLHEIIRDYLPKQEPEYRTDRSEKPTTKKYGNLIKLSTLNTLFYARIKDIETVLLQRDRTGNVHLRENGLFMYRYCCCHYYNDTAKALQMTLELFNKLSDRRGYTEKDIERRTKSGEKYYLKRNKKFSNKKIIELLGITDEEQDKLLTLISKKNARVRKYERDKQAYRKRLETQGKVTKDTAKERRRNKIKELLGANKCMEIICIMLGISKATYYRDLEVIRKEDSLINEPTKYKGTKTHKKKIQALKTITERQKIKKITRGIGLSQKFRLCFRDVVLFLRSPGRGIGKVAFISPLSRGQP